MNYKLFALSACLLAVSTHVGHAQDIRLTVDRGTGAVALENLGTAPSIMKGYSIGSEGQFLQPDAWGSLTDAGLTGWIEANPDSNWLSELNRNSELLLNAGQTIDLGTPYLTGGHQGDVVFEYITDERAVLQAPVHYTGPANDFAVYVDPTSGMASLANLSTFITAPSIKGYSILSESGALTAAGWNSMASSGAAGTGWVEANPAAEHLSELNRTDATLFSASTAISIGQILDAGSAARDLVFEYYTVGGDTLTGSVEYIPLPTTGGNGSRGDFNGDARVDLADADLLISAVASGGNPGSFDLTGDSIVNTADIDALISGNLISTGNKLPGDTDFGGSVEFADFLTLSGNFGKDIAKWSAGDFDGSGSVAFADFLALSGNFGKSSAASLAAVPEPSGVSLVACAFLLVLPFRKDARKNENGSRRQKWNRHKIQQASCFFG